MRIAYVLTSLGFGGAERQVVALAERMAARGHAVSLVVLLPRQSEEWPTTLDSFISTCARLRSACWPESAERAAFCASSSRI